MPHKVLVLDDATGEGEFTLKLISLVDHGAEVVLVHDVATAQAELCGDGGALYTHVVVDLYFEPQGQKNDEGQQVKQKNGIDFVKWLLDEHKRPPNNRALPLSPTQLSVFAWSWSPGYVTTMEGIVDQYGEMGWHLVTVKASAGDSTATRDMFKQFLRRPVQPAIVAKEI